MQSTNIPSKIPLPFANSAGSSYKNTIPVASQIGITNGKASLTDGFPPLTFQAISSGGVPPFGADFNGILNEITAIQQWQEAGGFFPFDSAFATTIGGYPKGAIIQSSSNTGLWLSTIENNSNNPDTGGAGWTSLAFEGSQSISVTTADVTVTQLQSAYPVIIVSGALTAARNLIFPATVGEWIIQNNTTGAFTLTAKTASGTGVTLTQGQSTYVYGDGTNIVFADSSKVASFNGRVGTVTLNATDVTTALGYNPANALAIGSFYGTQQYNSGITIPSTDRGKLIVIGSSGGTFTLPAASSVPVGGTLSFQVQGGTAVLNITGSDTISSGSSGSLTTITYSGQGYATLVSNGSNVWTVASASNLVVQTFNGRNGLVTLTSGDVTGALGYTPYSNTNPNLYVSTSQFGYSFAGPNNYQMLPTGMIIQFGQYNTPIGDSTTTTIAFPISFPNACVAVSSELQIPGILPGVAVVSMHSWINGVGSANFYTTDYGSVAANAGFVWWAIGY